MSDLDSQFESAVDFVRNSDSSFKPDNDQKLKFYSLYKQATEGDVKGKKPGITDFVGRSKYKAWEALKGTSADDAKRSYITLVDSIK